MSSNICQFKKNEDRKVIVEWVWKKKKAANIDKPGPKNFYQEYNFGRILRSVFYLILYS